MVVVGIFIAKLVLLTGCTARGWFDDAATAARLVAFVVALWDTVVRTVVERAAPRLEVVGFVALIVVVVVVVVATSTTEPLRVYWPALP